MAASTGVEFGPHTICWDRPQRDFGRSGVEENLRPRNKTNTDPIINIFSKNSLRNTKHLTHIKLLHVSAPKCHSQGFTVTEGYEPAC